MVGIVSYETPLPSGFWWVSLESLEQPDHKLRENIVPPLDVADFFCPDWASLGYSSFLVEKRHDVFGYIGIAHASIFVRISGPKLWYLIEIARTVLDCEVVALQLEAPST